jgi:MFS family permease
VDQSDLVEPAKIVDESGVPEPAPAETPAQIPAASRLGVLRNGDFRMLFSADAISQIGSQVTLIALPLVAVLALKAPPFQVGVLAAAETAAFLLVGLPAGAWVDRMRRRSVLIVGDLGRALLLGSIPIAWWAGVLTMPQLFVVALLTGVLTVFFDVAYQSYLPHLVGTEHLVDGNAKLQMVQSVSTLGGPTVGGLLVQLLTAPVAIAVDAVSFLGSALFVTLIRKREEKPQREAGARLGHEIMQGLRFVFGNRLLRAIAACTGSFNLGTSIAWPMLIVFLARDLHLAPGVIGVFFSVSGVGALVGAFITTPLARWLGQGPTIWLSTFVGGLTGLAIPLVANDWRLWLAAAANFVFGLTIVTYNVTQVSFRQSVTPDNMLGRMNATMRFVVWGTMPLGGVIGGALASLPAIGVHGTVWIGLTASALAFLPVFLSPLRTMRQLPSAPAAPA